MSQLSLRLNLLNVIPSPSSPAYGQSPEELGEATLQRECAGYYVKRAQGRTLDLEYLLLDLESFARYDMAVGGFECTRIRRGARTYPGMYFKSINNYGYNRINVNNVRYLEHHLVYLWITGEMPKEIDHIDGNRLNNKFDNLRAVNRTANTRNKGMQSNNISGYTGVSFDNTRKKWIVDVLHKRVGRFDSLEEAIIAREAYLAAHPELGFTARHGK